MTASAAVVELDERREGRRERLYLNVSERERMTFEGLRALGQSVFVMSKMGSLDMRRCLARLKMAACERVKDVDCWTSSVSDDELGMTATVKLRVKRSEIVV